MAKFYSVSKSGASDAWLCSRLHGARRVVAFLSTVLIFCLIAGCQNVLTESAKKDTDEALLYEARRLIDAEDYSEAVTKIQAMSTTGLAQRETKAVLASAYAGACGLNLVGLANDLSNAGATTLFNALLYAMKSGSSTTSAECKNAETALLSISTTAASRTEDENIFLAFVEFAKLGSIMASSADSDGDGVVDAGFDACSSAAISDADIGEVGTAVTISLASIQASGSTAAGSAISSISSVCTDIDNALKVALGDPSYSGFCNKTDASSWSAAEIKAIRSLTRSNEVGLATCNDTVTNCFCP